MAAQAARVGSGALSQAVASPREESLTEAAAAAAVAVAAMDDGLPDLDGADLITNRLVEWGIAEDDEEEETILVDEHKACPTSAA
jgi:hypothetical protein